ncbi:autotransporter domain-containing protein [Afipia sp. GAS231]|uniref:autotransporter domain-containing protein n=1 Tax=Afipia sp. GAS231 TaxID=1882747 RepID=UPI001FCD357E|nr:autotransporter domain-containing protein [Afipia sp. GAS231]
MLPRYRCAALIATSVAATLVAGVAPAVASDKIWNGAVDFNFTTGANWIGGAPGSTDNAVYDPTAAGGTNTNSLVNASVNINSISLQGGYSGLVFNPAGMTITFATSISVSSGIFDNRGVLTGAGALNASGGIVLLGGTSSYTGATTISGSAIVAANSTNAFSASSAFAVGSGGTLDLRGFDNTIGSLADVAGSGGAITNTSAGATAATLTTGGDNTSTSYAGTINDGNGVLGLVKVGTGTMVLAGANGYTGGTTISGGTIQVTNANSVGTGPVTLDGGTFKLDGSVSSVAFSNDFKVNTSGGTIDNAGAGGASLTLTGVISNGNGTTGVLQLIDSTNSFGSVTALSGHNTYSGGTKVVDTTVQVNNVQSVGTGTVTLQNAVFQADGTTGDLTFTNNFKIDHTLHGSAIDANGIRLTIAGNISDGIGAGKLTVLDSAGGSGIVVLTGTNTYTGGTDIGSGCGCGLGSLQLGDATHTASIVGDVNNFGGSFAIVNANTSGITAITNSNGGITTFYGANNASTAVITNQSGGSTIFRDTSTAGNAKITNHGGTTVFGNLLGGGTDISTAGNATIDNNNGGTFFVSHSNAGTADITNRNGGATIFVEQSSAASATITNHSGGFTEFGSSTGLETVSAANARIYNNNGGTTDFNAFSTAGNAIITTISGGRTRFFDNSTGDKAQFFVNGTGYVDFSESSGPDGSGHIKAGSISGDGLIYIGGGSTVFGTPANTLMVGTNDLSTEFKGVIADNNTCGCTSGPGNFEKVGTGTLILSGTNTYTGTTVVSGGTLQVDGSIAASSGVTVNANGTLSGVGFVSATTVAGGGIFAPGGGAPGSFMTVSGNLAFQSGALYLVQLNSTTSSFANVIGAAALNGTVGVSFASGSNVIKQYTIMTTGSHTGTFSGVNAPGGLVGTVSFDPTHVFLNFALDFGAKSGLNVNQQNVASALTNFFNATGSIPASFASLSPAGLTQVSGELATGSQQATFDAMNLFLSLLTDPFIDGRGGVGGTTGATPFAEADGASGYAANRVGTAHDAFAKFATKADVARNDLLDPRWSVWGSAYGGGSNTSGNGTLGSQSATARAFGFAAGADYRISPDTLAGFALAGGGTNFSVSGFGTGRSDLFQAGAFVRRNFGAAYVTAAAAYGWQDVTTDRTVTAAGVDRLRAEFNANAYSGRVEGGYRFATPWMGITPYAAGQFTTYSLPAYAEQVLSGTGTFALNYAAKDVTASRTEFGVRADKSFAMPNGILTLRGRAAWAHDFNTDRNVTALFQTLPGASFVVNGAAQAHDSALLTGAAEMKWLNGWSAAAVFEGQFSNVTNSYAGKAVARYSW